MATGWLAVLKVVPWGDVIRNAPKVADAAKKLWSSVGRKTASHETALPAVGNPPDANSLAALVATIERLDSDCRELQGQMLSSSELIKALAEQNAHLIQRIELQRRRVLWLAAAMALTAALAIAALFMLLMPRVG